MKLTMRHSVHVVAFLLSPSSDPLNLVSFTSVFSSLNIDGRPAYRIVLLLDGSERSMDTGRIIAANGIPYYKYASPVDTLILIGDREKPQPPSPQLAHWIRRQATPTRRLVCVGSGIFTLAATGLLDGKRVTTHWRDVTELARTFPSIRVEKNPIFVIDGNIYSTAGLTAGIDTALKLVEHDHGHAAAASVARDLVVYMRRSGSEAQYSTILAQQSQVGGTRLRDLPAWAKERIAQRLTVSVLAKAVAMTPRTFARQFEAHFQTTPARWLQALRVEAACTHVEAQEMPLKAIAGVTGFRDEQALRRAFLQQLSLTPKQYRDRYCSLQDREMRLLEPDCTASFTPARHQASMQFIS